MARVALTFDGNPISPIADFRAWYAFDPVKAAKCCSVLAEIEQYSPDSPPDEQEECHNAAIDDICRENVTGYFRKFVEN